MNPRAPRIFIDSNIFETQIHTTTKKKERKKKRKGNLIPKSLKSENGWKRERDPTCCRVCVRAGRHFRSKVSFFLFHFSLLPIFLALSSVAPFFPSSSSSFLLLFSLSPFLPVSSLPLSFSAIRPAVTREPIGIVSAVTLAATPFSAVVAEIRKREVKEGENGREWKRMEENGREREKRPWFRFPQSPSRNGPISIVNVINFIAARHPIMTMRGRNLSELVSQTQHFFKNLYIYIYI